MSKSRTKREGWSANAYREPVEVVEAKTFAGRVSGEKAPHLAVLGVRQFAQGREEIGVLR